jgi:hypothetical protein
MEAVHTSETSVDNHFIRQYIPEDNSEHQYMYWLTEWANDAKTNEPPMEWPSSVKYKQPMPEAFG